MPVNLIFLKFYLEALIGRTRYEWEKVGGHLKQERTVNAKMGESAKFRAGGQGETFPFPPTRAVHSGVHSALH